MARVTMLYKIKHNLIDVTADPRNDEIHDNQLETLPAFTIFIFIAIIVYEEWGDY